ncbi:MAG: hypothetical protein PHX08_11715, partial [Lachnospiraceae bacterium]|nr:hypothetical protein [Lachnospiraceae bacterium]
MASFTDYLTQDGATLRAKMLSGKTEIVFTRMAWGDGSLPSGVIPKNVSAMVSQKATSLITEVKSQNNIIEVQSTFTNSQLSNGMYLREKGIFAKDGVNGTEILYIYANNGTLAEWIEPAVEGIIEKTMRSIQTFDQSSTVTVQVKNETYVTADDYNDHIGDDAAHSLGSIVFEDYEVAEVPTPESALLNIKKNTSIKTLLQYIKAFCKGAVTISRIANNLATTNSGFVLDARQGKLLSDSLVAFTTQQATVNQTLYDSLT